jgi:hypothetical protein
MPVPAFWTLFVFAICARVLLMYIHKSLDDSPNTSSTHFAYSSEVYASISRPLRLLRSIGSSLISTPGPIGLEFLCPGKTCSRCVSRLCEHIRSPDLPCFDKLPLAHPLPKSTGDSYPSTAPSQSKRRLMRKQLSESQHQTVDKR